MSRLSRRSATALVGGLAVVAVSAVASPALAGPTIVGSVSNLGSAVSGGQGAVNGPWLWSVGQTFRASNSGTVSAATAQMSTYGGSCNVKFALANVGSSGKPTNLLTAYTAPVAFGGSHIPVTIPFASGNQADVVEGGMYALLAQVKGNPGNDQCAANQMTWDTTDAGPGVGQGWKYLPADVVQNWTDGFNDAIFSIDVDSPNPVVDAPLTVNGGQIGFVSTPSAPTIAPVTLDGLNKTTTAALPLDIGDARGTGGGWNVQMSATPFTSGTHALSDSALTVVSPASAACDAGVTCQPAVNNVLDGVIGSSSTKLFSAAGDTGMGNQSFTPTFSIALPAKTYKGNYHSTWVVSLVTGP